MDTHIRPITPDDAEACGRIIYEAFTDIAKQHNFRPDFPSVESGIQLAHAFIGNPAIFGVVAEQNGQVVGSNFLCEWDTIRGVGPITVDPKFQGQKIGRLLMEAVIERGRGAVGIRLLQETFNMTSLSLYTTLGFEVKEPIVLIEGTLGGDLPSGVEVRPLTEADLSACAELCRKVHGFERTNELKDMLPMFTALVALREGRVVAYASAMNFWPLNYSVAESEEDMLALLSGAGKASAEPLAFLLPTRQASLFRWCLGQGMRVVKPLALMTMGQYQEPRGCYLPSVAF